MRRKLLGTYRTPRFRYGEKVDDLARGEVEIVGLSDGEIPWPIGKRGRAKSLVLFGALAKAVLRESASAIVKWWGVCPSVVCKWRKALAVPQNNEGTLKLRVAHGKSAKGRKAIAAMHRTLHDPERCEKIAAAKRGKPRPASVIHKMRKANLGKKMSPEARRKMSETHRKRGTRPPWIGRTWSAEEMELLKTLPAKDVAQRTGRSMTAVYSQRSKFRSTA